MALSFGISFAPNHPREVSEWCRASEEAGFERIGMVDSQAIYREVLYQLRRGGAGDEIDSARPAGDQCAHAPSHRDGERAFDVERIGAGASFCGYAR